MYIQVDIETETLLESLLENIEENENTKQVLEITRWLIKEIGCYGANTESEDIKQARMLLRNFVGILEWGGVRKEVMSFEKLCWDLTIRKIRRRSF